jgi:putative chitinase
MIEIQQLIEAGIAPTQAREFAAPLSKACALFDITTPARRAAFIAQAAHESAHFTALEESLMYRSPERIQRIFPTRVSTLEQAQRLVRNARALANRVYANRLGNGDESSGDGWNFRGRGLFQLTGRGNYTKAAIDLNRPYVAEPYLVARPLDACLTAGWYWHAHGLNALADGWNVAAITRRINGPAMLHQAERQQLADEALRAFA